MPTQRRTLKTPPAKAARRLFRTVPQYLAWIKNSADHVREKEHGSKKGVAKLARQLASRVLIRARAMDTLFRQYFTMPDGFPRRVAVQKLLVFNKPRDYTLRLPVNQTGPLRMFQMLVGHSRDLENNESMLRLNQSLTREVKCVLRRHLKHLLDDEDYVSPGRINMWLVPLLKKVISSINHSDTKHYYVTAKTSFPKEGMAAFISFTPKQDHDGVTFTIRLTFELTVTIADLPTNFKVRHPFPKGQPQMEKRGRVLIKEIKQSFEEGHRKLLLRCPVRKTSGLPDISTLHGRAKNYLEYTIERCGTAFTTKSLPSSFSQIDLGDRSRNPRVWDINYDDIENILFEKLTHIGQFRRIQEALFLYDILSTCGNKIVPKINKKTKRSLSLWLFKQGGAMHDMTQMFIAALELVRGCINSGFCPSFCQTQVNTLSPADEAEDDVIEKQIRVPEDDESSDEEEERQGTNNEEGKDNDEGEEGEKEEEEEEEEEEKETKEEIRRDKRSNMDKLLEILYEDNIRKAVYLIGIY